MLYYLHCSPQGQDALLSVAISDHLFKQIRILLPILEPAVGIVLKEVFRTCQDE